MKSIILAILIAFVPLTAAMGAELTNNEKEIISASIRNMITDPESARFKWVPLIDERKSNTYCGVVNAKNRLGGYAGDAPYIVLLAWVNDTLKASLVIGIGSADWKSTDSLSVVKVCNDAGYSQLYLAQ